MSLGMIACYINLGGGFPIRCYSWLYYAEMGQWVTDEVRPQHEVL